MNEEEAFNTQIDMAKQGQDVAFLQNAQGRDIESVLNKHLDATEILEQIERLLMGYEYDSNNEEWKPVMIDIMDQRTGQVIKKEQGPLIDANHVRMTVGYLKTFLNANVYLSNLEKMEQVNEIMWDVKKKITVLLHPLKKIYDSRTVDVIGSMIENPIYFALTRGYKKNTLDAVSKMQHSIEHLNSSGVNPQSQQQQQKKQFKIFGF